MTSSPDKLHKLDELMPHIRETLAQGRSVAIGPKGTSMMPLIRQGKDFVELSPVNGKLKKYDLPLYQRDNGKYVLHRIVEAGQTYTCIGDNQFQTEPGLRHDQMIAVVTAFYRGEREVRCSSLGYQIYCRVWHYSRPVRHFWRRGVGWLRRHLK